MLPTSLLLPELGCIRPSIYPDKDTAPTTNRPAAFRPLEPIDFLGHSLVHQRAQDTALHNRQHTRPGNHRVLWSEIPGRSSARGLYQTWDQLYPSVGRHQPQDTRDPGPTHQQSHKFWDPQGPSTRDSRRHPAPPQDELCPTRHKSQVKVSPTNGYAPAVESSVL